MADLWRPRTESGKRIKYRLKYGLTSEPPIQENNQETLDVWMLGVKTLEEAKETVLSNPYYSDVTFSNSKVLRDGTVIGYLQEGDAGYFYAPTYEKNQRASRYRYSTSPSQCKCESCGFTQDMFGEYEGLHCPDIVCPSCGGRMWRVKK